MPWFKNLFKHRCRFQTTHINKWRHPTRQHCKCGLVRVIKSDTTPRSMSVRWEYSDGTVSGWFYMGDQIGSERKC